MLADSLISHGGKAVLPEPALVGSPSDGWGAEKLLPSPISSSQGLVRLQRSTAGEGQAFLVAQIAWGADSAQAAQAAYGEIAQVLQDQGLTIIHERLFGSLSVKTAVLAARAAALSARGRDPDGPLTYIQGHPPWGEGFAGVIIRAVSSILETPSVRAEPGH